MKPAFGIGKDRWFVENGYGQPRGTVHVGVNDGVELGWYLQENQTPILGFEPHDMAFAQVSESFKNEIDAGLIKLVNIALHNQNGFFKLNVPSKKSDNTIASQGSSLLKELYLSQEYEINPGNAQYTLGYRFDFWMETNTQIDILLYDLLVIDVQGLEFQVLEGFGKYLSDFKYLVVECSEKPLYQEEADANTIIEFLSSKGFKRMTPVTSHNDILFLKT